MSVARSIVPPVVAPAPTVEWTSSMNRIGFGLAHERRDDGLEALFEVAAESCAGEERRRIQGIDLGALEDRRDVVLQQPLRQSFGERGLAHSRFADEHRVVLAPAAENLHRAPQLVRASDQRIELARPRRVP